MFLFSPFMRCVSLLACVCAVHASYDSSSSSNVAVYWGQNSEDQSSGSYVQQRLSYYCSNSEIDIIPIAFLIVISDPEINFANAGNNCTAFTGSTLLDCLQLEADITECQNTYGKTILLSVGGATYSEGGFSSSDTAVTAANNIWNIFGPTTSSTSTTRPFGTAVVDGFDFDFESTVSNMPAFANRLRSLMDKDEASTGKRWLLTAAPQCPYPDSADNPMLDGASYFDIIWIQFYNNYCGLTSFTVGSTTQNNFNYETWDNWAKTVSLNPDVKLMLGIPAAAKISGYEDGTVLADIIAYCKTFTTFAGVMIWDMSLLYANSGFLSAVTADLGITVSTITSTPTTSTKGPSTKATPTSAIPTSAALTKATSTTKTTALALIPTSTSPSSGGGTVGEWDQCGGEGWTGGTVCISPYVCTVYSVWYSQCEASDTAITTVPASVPVSTGEGTVHQWNQCGGEGWTGGTICVSPYTCTVYSVWYSQCE